MNTTISNIRLHSHQLLSPRFHAVKDLTAWMGAMQAQDYNMAKWAIGIRIPGCTEKEVEEAFRKGEILRTHVMRPTWHFVTPKNLRWMLPLSSQRIIASSKSRDRELGITEALYSQTNRIITKALEGGNHLTKEALAEVLEQAGVETDSARMTHFLMRAEAEGVVCSGAVQGKQQTYALFDERVPPAAALPREEALAKLARIYFTSHCPATLPDFAWWSGLSLSEVRQGLEAVKADFQEEIIDGRSYWIADALAKSAGSAGQVAHLLPAFDEYIISYKDRTAVLPSADHSKAVSSNGVFRPTITIDGQVKGLWKKATGKSYPVALDFFQPSGASLGQAIQEAIRAYSLFIYK